MNKFNHYEEVIFTYKGKKYDAVVISMGLIVKSDKWEYTIKVANINGEIYNVKETDLKHKSK